MVPAIARAPEPHSSQFIEEGRIIMKRSGIVPHAWAVALFAVAACDSGTTAPPEPASMVAMTATMQNAVVASPAPVPPAVLVTDDRGRAMPGVQVTFAVTSGSGTVTGIVLTDAGGMAVASGWTMGTEAVENVLTTTLRELPPVVFRAVAAAGAPVALEKAGGDGQSVAAGTAVADSIGVRVVDQYGNGVPGQVVRFTSTAGTLSATRVGTGPQGHARVSLTVPIRPGTLQVVAEAGAMETQTFGVTIVPGPPASITRIAGNAQTGSAGMAVFVAPAVRVTDSHGNAIPGRTVTFTPAAGSGTVTGGTPLTGGDGTARVGSWVLGAQGPNRLFARVAGLDSLEFTATALAPCGTRTYTLFATLADDLVAGRCIVAGRNAEVYTFTVAAEQCLEFRMNSTQFDTYLFLLDNAGNVLAFNDDSNGSLNSTIRRRLAAGAYRLGAAAFAGGLGRFQLASTAVTGTCSPFPSVGSSAAKGAR